MPLTAPCHLRRLLHCLAGALLVGLAADVAHAGEALELETLPVEQVFKRRGSDLAFGFGALWAKSGFNLLRIDAETNTVLEIPLPGASQKQRRVTVGEDAVWIADTGADTVFKIDPDTNDVVLRVPLAMERRQSAIGHGDGSIWLMTADETGIERVLARLDDATGEVLARTTLPTNGAGIVHTEGSVWVTSAARAELYRVDAGSNALVQTVAMRDAPRYAVAGAGALWVHDEGDATISKIDLETGTVLAVVDTGLPFGRGSDIDFGGGRVWIASDFTVLEIDPASAAVLRRFTGRLRIEALRYGAGSLWIGHNAILRLALAE